MWKSNLALGALVLTAACGGPEPGDNPPLGTLTKHGVLVFDDTGEFTAEHVDASIDLIASLAPAPYDFGKLDGFELHMQTGRVVPECEQNAIKAVGCAALDVGHIYVAHRECDPYFTIVTRSVLAHEIGHALLGGDPGHTNDDWFGIGGIQDQVYNIDCK